MFARTERLLLRPAWPEDAAALAAALNDARVSHALERVPHPYTLADARAWVEAPRPADEASFLIDSLEHGAPILIGGIAIIGGPVDPRIGYWLSRNHWGRGYATEAGRAIIDMARHALPITRLSARHFADNPASGRVLRKLGFRPTGDAGQTHSAARGESTAAVGYTLDLDDDRSPLPIAA
ncbi:GNAT family N-acetyltransferase [Sphingomonas sp. 1P08PE]|uniref:GNAT family N-acetyltransferase n=1 Tax=Sphingomonas sp. 1P08PE TaxID=554122 RepID=UPI00399F7F58